MNVDAIQDGMSNILADKFLRWLVVSGKAQSVLDLVVLDRQD